MEYCRQNGAELQPNSYPLLYWADKKGQICCQSSTTEYHKILQQNWGELAIKSVPFCVADKFGKVCYQINSTEYGTQIRVVLLPNLYHWYIWGKEIGVCLLPNLHKTNKLYHHICTIVCDHYLF